MPKFTLSRLLVSSLIASPAFLGINLMMRWDTLGGVGKLVAGLLFWTLPMWLGGAVGNLWKRPAEGIAAGYILAVVVFFVLTMPPFYHGTLVESLQSLHEDVIDGVRK